MKKNHVSRIVALVLAFALVIGGMTTTAFAAWTDIDPDRKYTAQFDTLQELAEYEERLNVQIGQESFILLKNENETLPLESYERYVTVLGTAADTPSTGGGSGALSRPYNNNAAVSGVKQSASLIYDALELAGIKYNPRTKTRYLTVNPEPIGGSGMGGGLYREGGHYMEEVEDGDYDVEFGGRYFKAIKDGSLAGADDNYGIYGDAAIVFLSRSGSEGADNFAHSVQGHKDQTEHYSTLSDSEYELLAYAKYHFDKIIVILNTPAVLEIGNIQDDDEIGAVVWVGQTGWNGIEGLGAMLVGDVDFSGRTVDFWMRDMKTDPTYYNFGNYSQALYAMNGEYELRDGSNVVVSNDDNTVLMLGDPGNKTYSTREHAIDYAEGIFMGYRYYETVAAELTAAGEDGEAWYQEVTLYPFGYGLSYTTFEQEIVDVEGDINDKDGELTVSVKVTNTGDFAGKEVVQLYSTAPYFEGEIDKPEVALVQFEKTGLLKPGKSQIVKLTFAVKDLANFDYNDANANDYCGYELEEGDYKLSIRANSHVELDAVTLTCTEAGQWDEDGNPETPNNIFSQDLDTEWGAFNTNAYFWTESEEDHYLHRDMLLDYYEDLTQLSWLLTDDNYFKDEAFNILYERQYFNSYMDHDNKMTQEVETDYVNAWTKTKEDIPESWTQGAGVVDEATGMYPITLGDMIGVPFDDPLWDEFLNQLTWEELTASLM
ncbi:MAG: glycoside hydrolase family 3 C-terminal domain-containing protein, partial [Lachnospiraceae bacterium]|nr:glycoside hydrolase family 3 C-terminal domain-containing protein [Lachnospiraceae bacterium]